MHELAGERILMRIHVNEGEKHGREHVYDEVVRVLREKGLAGATMFRGSMSFGPDREVHTDLIEVLSYDLPIVIECVDEEAKIREVLPLLDQIVGGGVITLERANVILYRTD